MLNFKLIAEKYIDPIIDEVHKKNIISRNEVMHDSVEYLENVLVNETDILQEYFIPRKNFIAYIDRMRTLLQKSKIPLLNASVHIINKESNTLNYAPQDMFAIVLYLNQRVDKSSLQAMEKLTSDLIDLVLSSMKRFFSISLYYTASSYKKPIPPLMPFLHSKEI